eukprot:Hpha_TRINITY_DN22943_c0_g1::TRINITY_DN22943_c0_g1_i1::g.153966::m.153966/K01759/GLO1, gloA; lactoylglutathione lyase
MFRGFRAVRAVRSLPPCTARAVRWAHDEAARPFRVLGLQQVAIGALKKDGLVKLWNEVLGVPVVGNYKAEKENVDEDILRTGRGLLGTIEIDLMQPINPDKAPKVHVPQLNHIGLWVDDLDKAYDWLQGKGVRFTPGGVRKGASGHNVCFIHPKGNAETPLSGEGVLLELVQAPQDVIAAYDAEK